MLLCAPISLQLIFPAVLKAVKQKGNVVLPVKPRYIFIAAVLLQQTMGMEEDNVVVQKVMQHSKGTFKYSNYAGNMSW